jgi:hypothetical protein
VQTRRRGEPVLIGADRAAMQHRVLQ